LKFEIRDAPRPISNLQRSKDRYNNNNDIFIHIRLDDIRNYNPGLEYYLKALNIVYSGGMKIFIGSDEFTHPIISSIIQKYPGTF